MEKRIGKYRIIYEIIENRKVVVFHSVKLRKKYIDNFKIVC